MVDDTYVRQHSRLAEVARLFLKLGFTAFGGPAAHIAMMRREVVERLKWITDDRFLELVGIVNLIPGPNSTELGIYLGYVRAGWPGLVVAGVCFIGPAMAIVLALASLYVHFGTLPQTAWFLYGIKPIIIAIIAQAFWGLARSLVTKIVPISLVLLIVIGYLYGINNIILLFGSGIAFAICTAFLSLPQETRPDTLATGLPSGPAARWRDWVIGFSPWPWLSRGTFALAITNASVVGIFLTFLKIGSVLYGSGYVLLAFLRSELVLHQHLLTNQQLLDAISVGQFTPGPVFTTATFIGYLIGGVPGALAATLGIFLPSFVFVALVHPLARRLKAWKWTNVLLKGVSIGALGLMAGVLLTLGQAALIDPLTVGMAIVSLVILLRFPINSAWLILAGGLVGFLARG